MWAGENTMRCRRNIACSPLMNPLMRKPQGNISAHDLISDGWMCLENPAVWVPRLQKQNLSYRSRCLYLPVHFVFSLSWPYLPSKQGVPWWRFTPVSSVTQFSGQGIWVCLKLWYPYQAVYVYMTVYIYICYIMLCYLILCYVILSYVMLCYLMLCGYYIIFYYISLYYIILYYLILSYLILSYIILYYIILSYIILYYIILYYIILCYIILYYIILYYIILYIFIFPKKHGHSVGANFLHIHIRLAANPNRWSSEIAIAA